MALRHVRLTDQLRAAIDRSGMSRYRICKLAGLSEATMSRFMAGKGGLSMDVLDRLGEVLDLRLGAGASTSERKGRRENGKRE
jgi:transcriptional regulator with XRE-family HTH domain